MDTKHAPWWTRLEQRFERAGYDDRVRALHQGSVPFSTVGSPEEYAERIAAAVREMTDEFDGPIDILAHSMGGLSARWSIERLDPDLRVDDLVTLGTPHRGTSLAFFFVGTPGGRAMVPGSEFLSELNADGLEEGVSYTAIWSDADGVIVPPNSAALDPGWFPSTLGARNVHLEDRSHMELVSDPDLVTEYLQYLD
jgi:triacylglycerol lipase